MIIRVNDLSEIAAAAEKFLEEYKDKRVFAFYGEMGAGKTTFIKALCEKLNVLDVANSPTFSIVNEYHVKDDNSLFHFDFYRIENLEEAYDFGYEDYFYSGKYCFIEWPEKIENLLPDGFVKVHIVENDDYSRDIIIA